METIFDLDGKEVYEFEVEDFFNPQNTIKGLIHKRGRTSYGALRILEVNGREAIQNIWSAPKISYPFSKDDRVWDRRCYDFVVANSFDKLDGTAIMGFQYHDADGNEFITFKTRRTPTLIKSEIAETDFYVMWCEMLVKYPQITDVIKTFGGTIICELYGSRNFHLVKYKEELETRVLFGVIGGKVYSPDVIDLKGMLDSGKENEITTDFPEVYDQTIDKLNEITQLVEDEQAVTGTEGRVWYLEDKHGEMFLYKCKPKIVLDFHWRGDRIPASSLRTTIINAYEESDKPSFDLIIELLSEEFSEKQIHNAKTRIGKILAGIEFDRNFKRDIYEKYEMLNLDINADKGHTMRTLVTEYPEVRKCASKVFSALWNRFGIK